MKVTKEQKQKIKKHSLWLSNNDAQVSKYVYNRTIEIASKYEHNGDADKWLLYLANNVWINERDLVASANNSNVIQMCPIVSSRKHKTQCKVIQLHG